MHRTGASRANTIQQELVREYLLLQHAELVAGFGLADHHLVTQSEESARDVVRGVVHRVNDVEIASKRKEP